MEIKTAKIADVATLSRIHALSWKAAYIGMVPQEYLDNLQEDYWVERFTKWLKEGIAVAKIIYDDKMPAGCITYGKSRDENMGDWGEIMSLYLLPEYFGKGYGEPLLKQAVDDLKNLGCQKIYLWALRENLRAIRFYEKQGFINSEEQLQVEIMGENLIDFRYVYEEK